MKRFLVLPLVVVGMLIASPALASISVTSAEQTSLVAEFIVGLVWVDSLNSSLTGGVTTATSTYTNAFSTTTTAYGATSLSADFNHVRSGGYHNYNQSYGTVYFTANDNESFTFSGDYSIIVGNTTYIAKLFDVTLGSFVFDIQEGDFGNVTVGATGNLVKDHEYYWHYSVYNEDLSGLGNSDGGATAMGGGTLTVGNVPEPTALAIWGLGIAGFCCVSGRRRIRR